MRKYDVIAVVEVDRRPSIAAARPIMFEVLEYYGEMWYAHVDVRHPDVLERVERLLGPDMEVREIPSSEFEGYEVVFFIKRTRRGLQCWDWIPEKDDEAVLKEMSVEVDDDSICV